MNNPINNPGQIPGANIKIVPTDSLIEYARNPRKNDVVVSKMVSCIKEFGFRIPIVAKSDGLVVDGHLRLKAARKLGLKEVPVIIADDLTEAQIKAFRLVANQSANWAEWDEELLKLELEDLQKVDFNLDLTGFDLTEIEKYLDDKEEKIEDDFDVQGAENNEVISQIGDVWILGQHRLMCGDSCDRDAILKLMDGNLADCVFTDPPYGYHKKGIINDDCNDEELLNFNRTWIPYSFEFLKKLGSWYCWGADEPLMDIYSEILKPMIKAKKIVFRNLLTWDKGDTQGQLSKEKRMYPIADEKCLFVMSGFENAQNFSVNAEDYSDKMDVIRKYLDTEIKKLKLSDNEIARALGYKVGRTVNHWHSTSQFSLPTRENYEKLKEYGQQILENNNFLEKDYESLKQDYHVLQKEYDILKQDFFSNRSYFDNTHDNMNNVWHFSRTSLKEREDTGGHATPKPLELCRRAIKSSTRPKETVLDLFGGSGSTLIACEQLNRQCYIMELSPKYCDVIIKRWEKLTGQKAINENTEQVFMENQ